MQDMDILSQMIKSTALVQLEEENDKRFVRLSEPQAPDSCATIRHLPADTMVIKADKFPAPKAFFKGDKGECKRADFIIISEEKKVILYIELKAGAKVASHIVKQLKGASCLISYCKEIGRQFWNESTFLDGYAHRYIGMINLSVSKKPTRHKSSPLYDSPESFMKISSPHYLQFNNLAKV